MSRVALTVVPVVSVAVVAVGLRLGAGESVRGAIVWAAPRSPRATAWHWQVRTFGEYWGARETISVGFRAIADAGGKRVEARGHTNDDGVAEIELATDARPERLELRADDDDDVLASGPVRWEDVAWDAGGEAWVKPTTRKGPIDLSIAAPGARLVAGFPGAIVVRVEGAPAADVELTAEGDGALDVDTKPVKVCPSGRAALVVTPQLHVAALTLRAKAKDGRTGEWYGPVPVAHGGMQLGSLDVVDATTVTSPGNAKIAYWEVNDDAGRLRAGIMDLAPDATEPRPHGRLPLDGLADGDYWVAVSPDPTGAEKLEDAAIARRVHVAKAAEDPCAALDRVARASRGFPRWVAIDGMVGKHVLLARRRGRGRSVALLGLIAGGLAELLLVMRAARAAKRSLAQLERGAPHVQDKFGALEIALALALALLGFALLAALVAWLG